MIDHPVFRYQCPGTVYLFEPWAARLEALLFGPFVFEKPVRPERKKKRRKR